MLLSAVLLSSMSLGVCAQTVVEERFIPLRPPVLGHTIEWDEAQDLYRLVSHAPPAVRQELVRGGLDDCQERLVTELERDWGTGHPNLPVLTSAGMQFWADVFWFADWRIQENVFTGHCRLLDPGSVRRAWGSRGACRTAFERLRARDGLRQPSKHLVLLLHGLGRTRDSLSLMDDALVEAGYATAGIGYPSTRRTLSEHAAQVAGLLDRLEGIERVSFVTHSLGGLVVRATLALDGSWKDRVEISRLVMLAPPSRGSNLAKELEDFVPAQIVLGPAAQELAMREVLTIPPPECSFGIVAAGGPGEGGWNPLIPGNDDGIVSVEETRLEGADDFLLVRGLHTFFMNDPDVIDATVRFLDTGRFDGQPVEPPADDELN
jgi:pimeloyl-ACP methyl ester carboxylesterase